jgi:hypothetical protein
MQLTLSTVLTGTVLVVIVGGRGAVSGGKAALAGLCVVLLPVCGANGLVFAPALALWLAGAAVRGWVSAKSGQYAFALVFAAAALVFLPVYFIGFERNTTPPSSDAWTILKGGVMFMTMALGMAAEWLWPAVGFAIIGLMILTVGTLFRACAGRAPHGTCAIGLLFFLGACGCLTAAIGYGRGEGSVFEQYRYIVLSAPLLAGVYLAWILAGGPAGRLVQMTLFVAVGGVCAANCQLAWESAEEDRARVAAFEKDLQAGTPLLTLVERHWSPLIVCFNDRETRERLAGYILLFQKHGDRNFREVRYADLPHGERIDFTRPLPLGLVLRNGWYDAEPDRRWCGREAVVLFRLEEADRAHAWHLRMAAATFGLQPIVVDLNGQTVATLSGKDGPPEMMEIELPSAALREYNVLTLVLPEARSPRSVGAEADERVLGLGVAWVEFVEEG